MTPDKPLHVRVAEALGCTPREIPYRKEPKRSWWTCGCELQPHNNNDDGPADDCLKEYDTDWSATGPLIEKYRIELEWERPITPARDFVWTASWGQQIGHLTPVIYSASDTTPLIAVCNLLLALHAAGKLPIAA
jgi:hypothetical protein